MYEFTLGCDPELFVRDLETNGFVSAHDLIPGTKKSPFAVPGGAIQVDGTAVEFNINPVTSFPEWMLNIGVVLDELYERIEGPYSSKYIAYTPTAVFEPKYFDTLPVEAKALGCEPDFDAYTGEQNIPPETKLPIRTAGGHIHIGWTSDGDINDPEHIMRCVAGVKQLDALLYPASKCWDNDERRRELYGRKGAFRPKQYGFEYRPLSCMWLETTERQQFVYETTMKAMDWLFNKGIVAYDE